MAQHDTRPARHLQARLLVRHGAVSSTSGSTTPACRWPILPPPASPLMRRNNFSIYGVAWTRWSGVPPRTVRVRVGVFARLMGAPGDRNLINFSVNAGVTVEGAVAKVATTIPSASASASPRSAAARGLRPRHRVLLRQPHSRFVAARPSSRSPTSFRPPAGGRCSRTSSTCSTRVAASPTRTIPAQRIGNEAIFGLRST